MKLMNLKLKNKFKELKKQKINKNLTLSCRIIVLTTSGEIQKQVF